MNPPAPLRSPPCAANYAIVSITYDDALPCHFEMVAPLLEAHGLRATFYLPAGFLAQAEAWKRVADAGHELGNHTLFHPCRDAAWLDAAYNLRHYTPQRWRDEVKLANDILQLVDGQTSRSFGNTCHETSLGDGDGRVELASLAPDYFVAARGAHTGKPVDLKNINWFNLGTKGIDGATFATLQAELETLAAQGGWLIYTLHGVGPRDHPMYLGEDEHRELIAWLGAHTNEIWTAPVREVAAALRTSEQDSAKRSPA